MVGDVKTRNGGASMYGPLSRPLFPAKSSVFRFVKLVYTPAKTPLVSLLILAKKTCSSVCCSTERCQEVKVGESEA